MLQRYTGGAWQDIEQLQKNTGSFADCEFARRQANGGWIDVWTNTFTLKKLESYNMDSRYIQVNNNSLIFQGSTYEDDQSWITFGIIFNAEISLNINYDFEVYGYNYDFNNTWKYSSHLALLQTTYRWNNSNNFHQVDYFQASTQKHQRYNNAIRQTGNCFGIRIGTLPGVRMASLRITISNVIINGIKCKFES